jgi:hypothetical protein
MATRKSIKAEKVDVEEPPAEEEESEHVSEPNEPPSPYKPVHVPKNPLLFPPRGPGRPHMQQVLSEPDLRRRFLAMPHENTDLHLQADKLAPPSHDYAQGTRSHEHYREGLGDLLRTLEKQTHKKKERDRIRDHTEKCADEMRRAHQLFLEGSRVGKQKSAWTYTDAANFFEYPQLYEQGESMTCSRNQLLTGIFDVPHPDFKPPHHEPNVHGTWNYFQSNIHNEQLYEFRDKEWQGTALSPQEKMFKERLERSVADMTATASKDAFMNTTGSVKKTRVYEAAGDHSCLKRIKKPFVDQQVSTHTFFHTHPPYKPGDHEYETGIQKYIVEPDRAMSHTRQVIVGDETSGSRKSFWKCPSGPLSGTNARQTKAKTLLSFNIRGCKQLTPKAPDLKRKVLLKGTGSLSFTTFKDALQPPTYECFSPADRSGPP